MTADRPVLAISLFLALIYQFTWVAASIFHVHLCLVPRGSNLPLIMLTNFYSFAGIWHLPVPLCWIRPVLAKCRLPACRWRELVFLSRTVHPCVHVLFKGPSALSFLAFFSALLVVFLFVYSFLLREFLPRWVFVALPMECWRLPPTVSLTLLMQPRCFGWPSYQSPMACWARWFLTKSLWLGSPLPSPSLILTQSPADLPGVMLFQLMPWPSMPRNTLDMLYVWVSICTGSSKLILLQVCRDTRRRRVVRIFSLPRNDKRASTASMAI